MVSKKEKSDTEIKKCKCEHCTLMGWYVKIITIPYRGGWVVCKRPKTPLRNIKMAP